MLGRIYAKGLPCMCYTDVLITRPRAPMKEHPIQHRIYVSGIYNSCTVLLPGTVRNTTCRKVTYADMPNPDMQICPYAHMPYDIKNRAIRLQRVIQT